MIAEGYSPPQRQIGVRSVIGDSASVKAGQLGCLVEVAVEDTPVPADRQLVAAHHARNRRRVEGADEPVHVAVKITAFQEQLPKPAVRVVGYGEQVVELDVVVRA